MTISTELFSAIFLGETTVIGSFIAYIFSDTSGFHARLVRNCSPVSPCWSPFLDNCLWEPRAASRSLLSAGFFATHVFNSQTPLSVIPFRFFRHDLRGVG